MIIFRSIKWRELTSKNILSVMQKLYYAKKLYKKSHRQALSVFYVFYGFRGFSFILHDIMNITFLDTGYLDIHPSAYQISVGLGNPPGYFDKKNGYPVHP